MKTLQQTEMNLENAQRKIEELTETLSKTQNELKEKTEENAKLQIQIGTYSPPQHYSNHQHHQHPQAQ